MANDDYNALSDEDEFHSPDSSPIVSKHHEVWVYDGDIGKGGFGVVKLYVHKVEHLIMYSYYYRPFLS